ncbi:hypothetical protein X975_20079, partial [Stegodyphus mimosarum]
MLPGVVVVKRITSSMNSPNCYPCRRPSQPSWTKPPSFDSVSATSS